VFVLADIETVDGHHLTRHLCVGSLSVGAIRGAVAQMEHNLTQLEQSSFRRKRLAEVATARDGIANLFGKLSALPGTLGAAAGAAAGGFPGAGLVGGLAERTRRMGVGVGGGGGAGRGPGGGEAESDEYWDQEEGGPSAPRLGLISVPFSPQMIRFVP
jgi:hypothetical protein